MQVSVEKVSDIKTTLKVSVPAEEIDNKVKQKLQEVSRTANVPGFRPGKVPFPVITKHYGQAVRQDVVSQVIQDKLYQAILDNKLQVVGMPNVKVDVNEMGQDLSFSAESECFPEVDVKDLDKMKVEKWASEAQEADIEKMFDTLKQQYADWKDVTRKAKKGDRVTLDFEGFLEGKAFDGGSATDMPLILGSNTMIPGFEDGLMGIKAEEARELNLTFPKEYHAENLAGKETLFKVTAKSVAEPVMPELNDEFATKFGVKDMDTLRKEVVANMTRELEFALMSKLKENVSEQLLKYNEIEVPAALVNQEIDHLRMSAYQRMGLTPKDVENKKAPELPAEMFTEQAKKRVTLGVLMNRVAQQNELKADADRVKARVAKLASVYEQPEAVVDQYYQSPEQLAEVEQAILEEQVMEKLLESMHVEEKAMDFYDVMREMGQNPANMVA